MSALSEGSRVLHRSPASRFRESEVGVGRYDLMAVAHVGWQGTKQNDDFRLEMVLRRRMGRRRSGDGQLST